MKVDVVLPAGGRIKGSFAREVGTEIKALIPVKGKTVLERTIGVLRATGQVERVVVIGPAELEGHLAATGADRVLAEGQSGPENVFRGLQFLAGSDDGQPEARVLILTTDLPFLTPGAIQGFLDGCAPAADLCLPVIRREAFEGRFPGSSNQYVPLRDGRWTMGGAFLVNPVALRDNKSYVDRVFAARKSQLAMARLLGAAFIAKFVCRRLGVNDIQGRCEELLHCKCFAVHDCAAELAYDIDRPQEYRYAMNQAS